MDAAFAFEHAAVVADLLRAIVGEEHTIVFVASLSSSSFASSRPNVVVDVVDHAVDFCRDVS